MRKNQNKPANPKLPAKVSAQRKQKRRHALNVDLASLLSIDHVCGGCNKGGKCCCATYEVCVSAAEMRRIISVLPEAARLCPHLETDAGFDNVFEEVEPGLYAIDTTEDGLCLFAFRSSNTTRCSLHAAASAAGLPLEQVKPKACLLWPMTFSEGDEVLSLTNDALSFSCNSPRASRSRRLSPSLMEAIKMVYGKSVGTALQQEANKGSSSVTLNQRNSME
jgi:ribosomal protein L32